MLIETPGLLLKGTEDEYLEKMKEYYKTAQMKFPENGKDIILFVSDLHILQHILRWIDPKTKSLGNSVNPYRAQRILWIKFIIEQTEIRSVYKAKKNWNIVFVAEDLKYCVVCAEETRNNRYKIVSAYFRGDLGGFTNTRDYEKLH